MLNEQFLQFLYLSIHNKEPKNEFPNAKFILQMLNDFKKDLDLDLLLVQLVNYFAVWQYTKSELATNFQNKLFQLFIKFTTEYFNKEVEEISLTLPDTTQRYLKNFIRKNFKNAWKLFWTKGKSQCLTDEHWKQFQFNFLLKQFHFKLNGNAQTLQLESISELSDIFFRMQFYLDFDVSVSIHQCTLFKFIEDCEKETQGNKINFYFF